MIMNREGLVESLQKLMSAVSSSSIVPKYSCFLFSDGSVVANNGTIQMSTNTSVIPEKGTYVPASHLIKLLTSIHNEEVDIIFDGDILKVKTNRIKGKLTTVPEEKGTEELPLQQVSRSSVPNALSFIEGAGFCRAVASEDLTTGPLCGVHVHEQWMFGSDRYRIFRWEEPDALSGLTFTLPVLFVDILDKFKLEVETISVVSNTKSEVVRVEAILEDGIVISTTVLKGNYPDLQQYFPASTDRHVSIHLSHSFADIVERHNSFLSNIAAVDRELEFSITKNKCSLSVLNKEFGVLEEEIALEGLAPDLSVIFLVNPSLIIAAVNKECDMLYYPEKNILMFESSRFRCLTPTRV